VAQFDRSWLLRHAGRVVGPAPDLPPETEEEAQAAVVRWADGTPLPPGTGAPGARLGDYLLHVPNGGVQFRKTAGRMKAAGRRAGVPDLLLLLPVPPYAGCAVEMKRETGGTVRPAQRIWLARLAAAGYAACVCRGRDAAQDALSAYVRSADLTPHLFTP
jgi:hypothetical protein